MTQVNLKHDIPFIKPDLISFPTALYPNRLLNF